MFQNHLWWRRPAHFAFVVWAVWSLFVAAGFSIRNADVYWRDLLMYGMGGLMSYAATYIAIDHSRPGTDLVVTDEYYADLRERIRAELLQESKTADSP